MRKGTELLNNLSSGAAIPVAPDRRRGPLAAICCGAMLIYALYLGALSIVLPFLGLSFHLGSAVSGRLFPADFSGFIVGVLVCGALSDHWGRKAVFLIGIAIYAVGLALFGLVPTFAGVLVATALIGAGTGAMETVASALISDLYPERRAFVLNAMQVAFGAGAALGPALAHLCLTHGITWNALYLGIALGSVGLFVALAVLPVPRVSHGAEAVDFAVLRRVWSQPIFLVLCLAQVCYVGAEVSFFSWMPTYFKQDLPGGAAWEAFVVTVFWITMTIGRIATGTLVDRVPLSRLLLILSIGGAIGSALVLVWTAPIPVLICVAWTGLCFSGIFGLILAEAGERYPTVTGSVFGGIVAAGGLGGALLPWIIGIVADTAFHWRGALLLIPAAIGSITILTIWVERQARPLHLDQVSGP